MQVRSFLKTVFTRSQKARALNFKSSFAAQRGKGLHLDLASQEELALNLAPSCAAAAKMLARPVLGNEAKCR